MKSPLDSLVNLLKRAPKGPPQVGATPHSVVWTENKWRLLRFGPLHSGPAIPRYATPILLVPSLINRWYVLDLRPRASLVEALVGAGFDVWLLDWGTPEPEDDRRPSHATIPRRRRHAARTTTTHTSTSITTAP